MEEDYAELTGLILEEDNITPVTETVATAHHMGCRYNARVRRPG